MKTCYNPDDIEIPDSLGATDVSEATICDILGGDEEALNHGGAMSGRPATRIYASDAYIVKLRTEYATARRSARGFVENAVDRERRLGIHHPSKTWFLIAETSGGADDRVTVANITERLRPVSQCAQDAAISPPTLLSIVSEMCRACIMAGANHERLLDLSMSNFAIDSNAGVFYVDDETYRWDDFRTFAEFVANIVRAEIWLGPDDCGALAEQIATAILEHFRDMHWCQVVAEDVRSKFMPDERVPMRDRFVAGLLQQTRRNYQRNRKSTSDICEIPLSADEIDGPIAEGDGWPDKIALLADVHANAPALDAVLTRLDAAQIDTIIVLGDVVGYGPHPAECIDMLQSRPRVHVLKGNHDHGAATGFVGRGFSSVAKWVLQWTASAISDTARTWLSELDVFFKGPDWMAVHGSPVDKTFFNAYVYEMTYRENLDHLREKKIRFCFHGHTHMQGTYSRRGAIYENSTEREQTLRTADHWLICPGSIGQPRDGVGGAQYAVLDRRLGTLHYHSVAYDVGPTLEAMGRHGFPSSLMDRLSSTEMKEME